ncbi:MAG: ATP-dependent sacrificial sulfur transferase LarE [Clostridia bacterium]|nr:ATP-dependent sacrificial sulfur transferase LarE [Clostridia bacterium]
MEEKLAKLKEWFENKNGVLVAFSGGVDSSLLLKVAYDVLGDRVWAVTANSPLNTPQEKDWARQVAQEIGARHDILELNDLENPLVRSNPVDRCYHCKKERFLFMRQLAQENGLEVVVEGSNLDDLKDYRPGLKAVSELGIASPLAEIGFSKEEIRQAAKELGLSSWNKPSEPCLATRIPFNTEITLEKIKRIIDGEMFIKNSLGLTQVRVRDHNNLVRIEVEAKDLEKVFDRREKIAQYFLELGFYYVTLDLTGYRTGSMNRSGGEI